MFVSWPKYLLWTDKSRDSLFCYFYVGRSDHVAWFWKKRNNQKQSYVKGALDERPRLADIQSGGWIEDQIWGVTLNFHDAILTAVEEEGDVFGGDLEGESRPFSHEVAHHETENTFVAIAGFKYSSQRKIDNICYINWINKLLNRTIPLCLN